MAASDRASISCWVLAVCTLYFFFSGHNGVSGLGIENHTIYLDLRTPGIIRSPGFKDNDQYSNYQHVVWNLYVSDILNMELFIYPLHVDLEPCCDFVTVTELYESSPGFTVSIMQGHVTLYKHAGYTMENYAALDLLKQLPMIESIGGMAKIFFQTDSSGTLSGFVLRYFAKSKHIVIPNPYDPLHAHPVIEQLAAKGYEFTIEVEEHERIWLQLVYINLSRTNMDQHNIDECIYSEEKIEIIDKYCSLENCLLAAVCRSQYTTTPVTLVSYGHKVSVHAMCDQPQNVDCVIMNYKLYQETLDRIDCPELHRDYTTVLTELTIDHYFNEGHSELTWTWYIEDRNINAEMVISVRENHLLRSPGCLKERVEIYMGKCKLGPNRLTYFCGGTRETYRITNSKYAVIYFYTTPNSLTNADRGFSIQIQVRKRAKIRNRYNQVPHLTQDTNGKVTTSQLDITNESLEVSPFPAAGEALQPIQDIVKNYPGLALLGLFVAICLVVTCIWLKCKARKRRQGRRVGAQRQPKPTAPPPRAPQPRAPQPRAPQSSAPPPAPNSEPPATTPSKQQMYAGPSFDSGGVPPPAVYNPPPLPFPNQFQTPPSPYTQTHATPPLQHFQPPPANFGQASPTRVNVVTPYPRQQHMPPPGSVPLHPPPMRGNSSHKCYLM